MHFFMMVNAARTPTMMKSTLKFITSRQSDAFVVKKCILCLLDVDLFLNIFFVVPFATQFLW